MKNDKTMRKQATPSALPLPQSQEATERIVHDLEAQRVELAKENEALRETKLDVQEHEIILTVEHPSPATRRGSVARIQVTCHFFAPVR